MSHNLPHHNYPTPNSSLSFSGGTTFLMIESWKVVDLSACIKHCVLKISQRNRFKVCEKYKIQ